MQSRLVKVLLQLIVAVSLPMLLLQIAFYLYGGFGTADYYYLPLKGMIDPSEYDAVSAKIVSLHGESVRTQSGMLIIAFGIILVSSVIAYSRIKNGEEDPSD